MRRGRLRGVDRICDRTLQNEGSEGDRRGRGRGAITMA